MDNVKFSYIRDEKNKIRVMTIARKVENGEITYATAINRCSSRYSYGSRRYILCAEDQFSKELGRTIASGRLKSTSSVTIPQDPNQAPHITILLHMVANAPDQLTKRLASEYLNVGRTKKNEVLTNLRMSM